MKILMVCTGNICRSPMAQGYLQNYIHSNKLDWIVDSAGTGGWHEGESPDHRAIMTASQHGLNIAEQRARKFVISDFDAFDWILVMDLENEKFIRNLTKRDSNHAKIKLLMSFVSSAQNKIVPDPYYADLFEESYQCIAAGCNGFINAMNAK